MEEVAKIISNLGFPIGVSVYLLFRYEKKIDDLSETIKGKDGILDKVEETNKTIKQYMGNLP